MDTAAGTLIWSLLLANLKLRGRGLAVTRSSQLTCDPAMAALGEQESAETAASVWLDGPPPEAVLACASVVAPQFEPHCSDGVFTAEVVSTPGDVTGVFMSV